MLFEGHIETTKFYVNICLNHTGGFDTGFALLNHRVMEIIFETNSHTHGAITDRTIPSRERANCVI